MFYFKKTKSSSFGIIVIYAQLQCIKESIAFSGFGIRSGTAQRYTSLCHPYEIRSSSSLLSKLSLKSTVTSTNEYLPSVFGEADQAFQLAVELEKKGLVRIIFSYLFCDC